MSLTRKRNRPYLAITIVFLLVVTYFGTVRIISFNIGNKGEITTTTNNIENTVDLFDDSQMHTITLAMTSGEYQNMLTTYTETKEKDYYKVDIIIDGVTIENVGVRLK
jgi:spore coat protein CotH